MKYIILVILFFTMLFLFSQELCPYNLTNDSFPGQCGKYIDRNNDSICDYSQDITSSTETQTINNNIKNNSTNNKTIGVIIIFIIWVLTNIIIYVLKIKKIISRKTINMYLNFILFILFIPVLISSLVLILNRFSLFMSLYSVFIRIHLLTGLAFALFMINHIIFKLNYYRYCIKGMKDKCEE